LYIPEDDKKQHIKRHLEKFRTTLDKQRSYLLYGPPGSGKSSFAIEYVNSTDGRIVKIDSSFFSQTNFADIKTTLENFECSALILDDIDRIANSTQTFLYILELVKQLKHKPVFFATANDISKLDGAVLRPGRFDEIIEFKYPTEDQFIVFLTSLLGRYGMTLSDMDVKRLAQSLTGLTKAYAKEYCEQLKIGESVDDVVELIKERKELMKRARMNNSEIITLPTYMGGLN
jgi:transitional endoplasmic reticulum ATPase